MQSAGLPVIATQLTYNKLAHTRKRRQQDITENIYLNDNKCNTLAEDGDIKKIWSGYYSQMLNKTNRKSNYTVARKTEGEVSPISVVPTSISIAISLSLALQTFH